MEDLFINERATKLFGSFDSADPDAFAEEVLQKFQHSLKISEMTLKGWMMLGKLIGTDAQSALEKIKTSLNLDYETCTITWMVVLSQGMSMNVVSFPESYIGKLDKLKTFTNLK